MPREDGDCNTIHTVWVRGDNQTPHGSCPVVCWQKDAGPLQGTGWDDWQNTSGLTGHNDISQYMDKEHLRNHNKHKEAPSQRARPHDPGWDTDDEDPNRYHLTRTWGKDSRSWSLGRAWVLPKNSNWCRPLNLTNWPHGLFQQQVKIMTEHNGWTLSNKAVYLTATLNKPAAHILHSDPTGAKYEEFAAVLENHYVDHHLAETFHAQLRRTEHAGESADICCCNRPLGPTLPMLTQSNITSVGSGLCICWQGKRKRPNTTGTVGRQENT